ncbi:MAG: thioredoxin family protein [Gemmatimonadota bacterium]|nr:MAG: thioredoxin family protein [Gemmatimonadota bacterium]
MRIAPILPAVMVAGLLTSAESIDCQKDPGSEPIYIAAEYDATRDPAADLALAVERAASGGKRILMLVGGTWCVDCRLLDVFIKEHDSVAAALREGFIVLKVNYSRDNRNEAFLSDYPDINWFPFIFVLERDGTLLHSKDTRELSRGRHFDEVAFVRFLDQWAPK